MQKSSVYVVSMRVKRKVFFFLVKVLLIFGLMLKPHNVARGERIYDNTSLQNTSCIPTQKNETCNREAPNPYREVVCNISAYTAHSNETGRGDGLTASGRYAQAGRTIAMDDVPFGTRVEIDGHTYIVEDRFGGGYTNRIDIYMDTKSEAFQWGRRHLKVKIYDVG